MRLSVVIPAYNEEDRIRGTLDTYTRALQDKDAELVVVVNGSSDQTEHLVRDEYLTKHPMVRLVVIPEKVGKGGAVMRGLAEAAGDLIAFTDADGSTPPESLMMLVDALRDAGICIGSRWMTESVIGRPQPLSRRIASRLFNGVVRILFSIQVTDTQCGAKVLPREVRDAVLPMLGCTQWAFDVELLFQIRQTGARIIERPIEWNDVSDSKVKILQASVEMTFALLRLRMRTSPLKGIVDAWDSTLGRKLYAARMNRMEAVYRKQADA